MGKVIIVIILVIVLYLLFGVAAMDCIYSSSRKDINPLWKIPLILLGPVSFIIYMCIEIYRVIKSYIQEIKEYYKRKDALKRREERRRMREYYE